MKHLKIYEDFIDYNIDDYVLLSAYNNWCVDVAKILDKKINPLQFFIRTYYIGSGRKWEGWINYSEIEKKISFEKYEEIKKRNFIEYKIKREAEKYNL